MAEQIAALYTEYNSTCNEIYDFLDGLDAIEILRDYTPSHKRHLLDRLENAVRLREKILQEIEDAEAWADLAGLDAGEEEAV